MASCARCGRILAEDFLWCPYDGTALKGGPSILMPSGPLAQLQDRFEVHGLIGEGAMASVYVATERTAGVEVAIKVMTDASARSPAERERFRREAKMMLPIRHPNIMHVFAFGELADGSPYIVMQYLDGETLGDLLRRGERADLPTALRIARETAAGLDAAHAEGIVHRDVKPDNIFLVGSPGAPRMVKVLDFGHARRSGARGLTASGTIIGTPEYLAPEQTVNDPTDRRTDVYALGIVLYRLVAGRLPFEGSTSALLASHLVLPPPPFDPDVPESVGRLVQGALRKLPRNRYPSMHDFIEDLDAVMRGEDIAGPSSLWDDVYVPQSPFAESIARILWRKARPDSSPPRCASA
jgi:serine/threonine-protein kinase